MLDVPDPRAYPLAIEEAVAFEVNGTVVATLMCTPRDLEVLALGSLFTRGAIASRDDVACIRTDAHGVHARLRRPDAESPRLKSPMDSGPRNEVLPRGDPLPLASIRIWVRQMFDRVDIRREIGGGMHSAGLADRDGLRCVYEDVGRHNAVDKAIGRGLADRVNFSRCCLVSSGRIAADMAAKAIAAGVPIFASRSIPTTAAYEMAVRSGLTLIGRVASDAPVVYTGGERLV